MQLSYTERNHYIPQFYLKSFSNNAGKIFVLDKQDSKVFCTTTQNIGLAKNLYTITDKISKNDILCMRKLCKISNDDMFANITLPYLAAFLNDDLISMLSIGPTKQEIIEEFKRFSGLDDENISHNQELLFCEYENRFKPIYDRILSSGRVQFNKGQKIPVYAYLLRKIPLLAMDAIVKKISLSNKSIPEIKDKIQTISYNKTREKLNTNEYYDCVHYITMQNLRTPKFFDAFSPLKPEFKKYGVNSDALKFLFIHYQSAIITNNIINDGLLLILLKNSSDIPFITSDAPVVNPYSQILDNPLSPPDGLEFYFPLSPKYAILLTKCCLDKNFNKEENLLEIFDDTKIEYWNKLIISNAERFLYSKDNSCFHNIN